MRCVRIINQILKALHQSADGVCQRPDRSSNEIADAWDATQEPEEALDCVSAVLPCPGEWATKGGQFAGLDASSCKRLGQLVLPCSC